MSYIRLPSVIKIPTLRRRGDIRLSIERKEKKRPNYKIGYFISCHFIVSAISRLIVISR